MDKIDSLIAAFDVLTLTDADAKEAGLLLAGMARARGETLVTGDRDFSAVRRDVRIRSYARSRR